MNRDLTIVFSSFKSDSLIKKILFQLNNNYKILVIENSCDAKIKKNLEKKFKNVSVIIPEKNLGLAKSYNLGIKKAKTKYVFLNNPDIKINNRAIKDLIFCAKTIRYFGVISPVYKIEKNYVNYDISSFKDPFVSKKLKKFDILEVDSIDNNFLVNKKIVKDDLFDENFFLYFETVDFVKNLQKNGKKLFVAKNIKFHHLGSSSIPKNFSNLVDKTRAFHYNWSKFYYFRKNFGYINALVKTLPSIIKIFKNLIINLAILDTKNLKINIIELMGIFSGISCLNSFYRPKN